MKKGTIIFNKDLTTIGKEAFKDCENLTSITIPKKVNGILANAFQNCINLSNIEYNGTKDDFAKIKLDSNWLNESSIKYVHCEDESINLDCNYLTFTALEDGCSIGFYNNPDASINPTIEYSFDKINWYKLSNNVSIKNNSNMYCRGLNPNGISPGYDEGHHSYFTSTGQFNVSGDIMTLIDYKHSVKEMIGTMMYMFGRYGDDYVDIVDASNLILSAKILTSDCYANMFDSCSSMVYSPQIEAEILAPYCYYKMFWGCTSLTTVPELPATKLEKECYAYMFSNCTSLTTAPELPAIELAPNCYYTMFQYCTSLTTAPEILPATTLAPYCYENMFYGCTSLTTAPELPATTLSEGCYGGMFRDCLLTMVPELPATTLAPSCYTYMFYGCTSLTTAPVLPATELAEGCYNGMFYGCTKLSTAPELPATTLAPYCYSYMFQGCTSLNYIKCLATDTSATDCLYNWVDNVYNIGVFIKNSNMNNWNNGNNGIPSGWNSFDDVSLEDDHNYLTFTALDDDCKISYYVHSDNEYKPNLEYSLDNKHWYNLPYLERVEDEWGDYVKLNYIHVPQNSKIIMRGYNPTGFENDDSSLGDTSFSGEGRFNVSGNVMTLIDYNNPPTEMIGNFRDLFNGNYGYVSIVDASKLLLPATTLTPYCYSGMFWGGNYGSELTAAPELPATTLAEGCYRNMFYNCTSLTTAPELPATELAEYCYDSMFRDCPLTTAPELPATTLAKGCYNSMFRNCPLTTAPELPATTLAPSCYTYMFSGCDKLNYIKCLATDMTATNCTSNWVKEVSSTGTFYKHPDSTWTTGVNGIPNRWNVVNIEAS